MCFIAAPAWAQDAKPNFTGTWILDVARSDNQSPAPESIVHVIDHKEPTIKITTRVNYRAGDSTDTLNLTTDGREISDTMPAMGTQRDRKLTARWDGGRLLTSMKFDAQGSTMEINDSWALSEDGRVLTLVRVAKNTRGEVTLKTVYNKQ
jgi:hypothetical protein